MGRIRVDALIGQCLSDRSCIRSLSMSCCEPLSIISSTDLARLYPGGSAKSLVGILVRLQTVVSISLTGILSTSACKRKGTPSPPGKPFQPETTSMILGAALISSQRQYPPQVFKITCTSSASDLDSFKSVRLLGTYCVICTFSALEWHPFVQWNLRKSP